MNPTLRKIAFILYQPYKWLFLIPFILLMTFFFGIAAVIFSSLFNPRVGSYIGGVIWSRLNAFITPMFVRVEGKKISSKKHPM